MKTKTHILATLIAMAAVQAVNARQLTQSEAYMRLQGATTQHLNFSSTPDAVATVDVDGQPALYLFALGNDKYALASADDNAPAMPGYFTAHNLNRMPPAMKAMLDNYAQNIKAQREPAVLSKRDAVEPLIKTSWDQESPYNKLCPMDGNVHAMTGCVATAMAQVMNYYRWPDKPVGTVTYLDGDKYVNLDLGQYTFEWDLMLDSYKNGATPEQINAVATLMYAAGRSVDMEYYATASWASEKAGARALLNNFGYAKSLYLAEPDYYSTKQWGDLMYEEVSAGRPIIFSGSSQTGGGHTFILDGADDENRYHINWGWGGDFNGYFLIDALNPTGVQERGYNWYQTAICGITSDPATPGAIYIVTKGTRLKAAVSSTKVTFTPQSFIGMNETMSNQAFVQCSGYFGLRLEPVDGGETVIVKGTTYASLMPEWNSVGSFDVNCAALPQGEYAVYPVFISGSDWADVHMTDEDQRTLTMKNNGSNITFSLEIINGVETVISDDTDTICYDLRGVRVTNPRRGTVCIRRDGSKTIAIR